MQAQEAVLCECNKTKTIAILQLNSTIIKKGYKEMYVLYGEKKSSSL
jgi:hypothetical protein